MIKLAAIGSNCIDYYQNINGGTPNPGGGPVNMAVYIKRLQGEASYIGAVGNDAFGEIMVSEIGKKGIDVSHLHQINGKTAVTMVELIDNERIFGEYAEGVLENYKLSEDDLKFIVDHHNVVICDLWGNQQEFYPYFKKYGLITAFDCATRPGDLASVQAIPYCDYVFFSCDHCDSDFVKEMLKLIHSMKAKVVVAMLAEEGSLAYDGVNFVKCGIVPVENVVDTMGAGDSYISGFLKAVVDGKTLLECMQEGAKNASETISYFGAW